MVLYTFFSELLTQAGWPWPTQLAWTASVVLMLAGAALVQLLVRLIILPTLGGLVRQTETKLDDLLVDARFLKRLAHLAMPLTLIAQWNLFFAEVGSFTTFIHKALVLWLAFAVWSAVSLLIDNGHKAYLTWEGAARNPIKSYLQVLKVVLFLGVAIFGISSLFNQDPWGLISGLGALTAVLLLVFKDPLLGLVASIQLQANDMVKLGDWIEMPSYGADGDVIDINLSVVKVRNWDQTITTVPTYALVSGSFKNWRNMTEAGGRRVKRAVLLDVNTVRFLDGDDLARLKEIRILRPYLERIQAEVEAHNKAEGIPENDWSNGRHLTNLGTFRAYMEAYLRHLEGVNQKLILLVRQLEPRSQGLPLELYFFTKDTRWAAYESLAADVFDHVFAVLPVFGLAAFQEPTGRDWRLVQKLS